MTSKERQIPELYALKTKNDDIVSGHDYSDVLERTTSRHLWLNDNVAGFMQLLQKVAAAMIDEVGGIRNVFNFYADKDYTGHTE